MKAAAMSVWVFINLLCFGMCGYLYLIWSQYWMYIEKQRLFSSNPTETLHKTALLQDSDRYSKSPYNSSLFFHKNRRSAVGAGWSGSGQPSKSSNYLRPSSNVIVRHNQGGPRFPNIHKPLLEFDSEKYVCDDLITSECEDKNNEFRELLIKEFHRVLMGDSKVFRSGLDSQNIYDVKYESGNKVEATRDELMCAFKQVPFRTVVANDEPFRRLGFKIPEAPLQERRVFNTCAVVTSAGALLGSRLGDFIDSHDMVLRFNNAPTENYTEDVGSKTTIRILNSQVVTKPEFKFLEDPLYQTVSILIWDPANFSSTLEDWYDHPDYPLFPVYKRLLEQRPDADVHLLNPKVLWGLWALLQDTSPYRLRRNPPSSGFLGLFLSLHRCKRVRVFEYVPSARATRRCHYYINRDDTACTLGSWHPLAQEKALAERLRDNSNIDVFQRGFIDVPGRTTPQPPNSHTTATDNDDERQKTVFARISILLPTTDYNAATSQRTRDMAALLHQLIQLSVAEKRDPNWWLRQRIIHTRLLPGVNFAAQFCRPSENTNEPFNHFTQGVKQQQAVAQ